MRFIYKIVNKLLYLLGFRIVDIPLVIRGIGHQIAEPATLIKRQQLGLIPPHFKFIFLFSIDLTYSKFHQPHINHHLLKYLKKYAWLCLFEYSNSKWERFKFRLFAPLIYPEIIGLYLTKSQSMRYEIPHYMADTDKSAVMFETNLIHKNPLFKIKKSDERYGQKILKRLGIPKNAWFVGFHYRDNKFYKEVDYWENNYSNRCVDIESYKLGLKEVVRRGGWCFRVAASNSQPMPSSMKNIPGVIDLDAIRQVKGDIDRFSVFVLFKSKFFLACNSGPSIVPGYFGVPTAQAQTAPFYGAPIHHFDLFIFKRYFNLKKNQYLGIQEIMLEPWAHIRLDESFQANHIQVEDNSENEVLQLVNEMFDMLDDRSSSHKNEYWFNRYTHSRVYCYKAASRVAKQFFEEKLMLPTSNNS